MEVKKALEEYRFAILENSAKTQEWYMQKLGVFADWCANEQLLLENVRVADVRRFIHTVSTQTNPRTGKPLSSYTIHGYAQVIKGFLNWCAKEDGLENLVSSRVPKRIDMPKVDEKVIEILTPEHIKALFAACEKEYNYILTCRDKAIISVLLDTGIRASELINLTLNCCFLEPYDAYLKVFGKGRKEREVGLGKHARTALHRYITRYRKGPKEETHVFLNRSGRQLTVSGLDRILLRLKEWARITNIRVSPHTMRHTYAVIYLLNGGDVYVLSRLMGHYRVEVTETYLKAVKGRQARKQGASVLDTLKGQ